MSWIGWAGSAVYLIAQILLALGLVDKRKYTFLNALAALLVSIFSIAIVSIQPIIINVLWSGLSCYALYHHCFHHAVNNRKLVTLMISVAVMVAVSFWLFTADLILALSIVSIWVYTSAYIQYLFFGLKKIWYLAACVVAPVILLPQLWLDGNFPVVAVQIFWLVFSAIGVARIAKRAFFIRKRYRPPVP